MVLGKTLVLTTRIIANYLLYYLLAQIWGEYMEELFL
jgi:hypothetical protein